MAKKQNKIVGWIKGFINGADAKLAKLVKADLEPKMLSVIGFSLITSIIIVVAMIASQAVVADEKITMAVSIVGAIAMFGYIIKMLLPNIKLIQSIGMRILYIVLNFVAVFIAGALAGYALSAVIMLVVAYFALMLVLGGFGGKDNSGSGEKDGLGREHVATLKESGIKIYKGKDLMMNTYYEGDDGNKYEPYDGGYRMI